MIKNNCINENSEDKELVILITKLFSNLIKNKNKINLVFLQTLKNYGINKTDKEITNFNFPYLLITDHNFSNFEFYIGNLEISELVLNGSFFGLNCNIKQSNNSEKIIVPIFLNEDDLGFQFILDIILTAKLDNENSNSYYNTYFYLFQRLKTMTFRIFTLEDHKSEKINVFSKEASVVGILKSSILSDQFINFIFSRNSNKDSIYLILKILISELNRSFILNVKDRIDQDKKEIELFKVWTSNEDIVGSKILFVEVLKSLLKKLQNENSDSEISKNFTLLNKVILDLFDSEKDLNDEVFVLFNDILSFHIKNNK